MNLDALIVAAREIDRKAQLQEARAKRYLELAAQARRTTPGSVEHKKIVYESRELSRSVVDFGDAINALQAALRAKLPKRRLDKAGASQEGGLVVGGPASRED